MQAGDYGAGFYRRPIPSIVTPLASTVGEDMFRDIMVQRAGSRTALQLLSHYITQAEPAYCGLTSLAMVLNALEIDPGRIWKGPWRWWSEELLDCCTPLEKVQKDGVTMNEFACLAYCNGAAANVTYASQSSLEDFRAEVERVTSSDNNEFMVISYCRSSLGQTGSGHFSPVGAYHKERDMLLVLDVARFKYPPYWVDLRVMWEAMLPPDTVTNSCRGFITVRASRSMPLVFCRLSVYKCSWKQAGEYFFGKLPELVREAFGLGISATADAPPEANGASTSVQLLGWQDADTDPDRLRQYVGQQVVRVMLSNLPSCVGGIMHVITADVKGEPMPAEHEALFRTISDNIEETVVYKIVSELHEEESIQFPTTWRPFVKHLATILLLALPATGIMKGLPQPLQSAWSSLADDPVIRSDLKSEIIGVRTQVQSLSRLGCKSTANTGESAGADEIVMECPGCDKNGKRESDKLA